ncbi:hypothetical protein HMPREF0005_00778 [Achromobacter xylosoxidans C54]|nr:hypothetical protein HMPREF0005_00778 [Achromobacter xylosoxidans C54]
MLSLAAIVVAGGYVYKNVPENGQASQQTAQASITTEEYLSRFDPERYMRIGTDYFNPRYSPSRLNKPIDQIDITYDYPFAYLAKVEKKLADVDRLTALREIFKKLTAGAKTNQERHLAVLDFLYKAAYHNPYVQPMYEDKQAVFDPIVLLKLGEMRCGGVARVAADLFEAAGYKTRLVQAHAHITTEIYYDGGWHLFEADLVGGPPVMINGRIPSVAELANNPFLIDKSPSHEEAADSKWYGWNYYETTTNRWKLTDFGPKYEPDPPDFKNVKVKREKFLVEWLPARDSDNDLLGYRVYVSSRSRGWNYQDIDAPESVKKYFVGGWKPEMYDSLYKTPPKDVAFLETKSTHIELPAPKGGGPLYVTVMPFDKHGESVGRRLYNMSAELKLSL